MVYNELKPEIYKLHKIRFYEGRDLNGNYVIVGEWTPLTPRGQHATPRSRKTMGSTKESVYAKIKAQIARSLYVRVTPPTYDMSGRRKSELYPLTLFLKGRFYDYIASEKTVTSAKSYQKSYDAIYLKTKRYKTHPYDVYVLRSV